MKLNGFQVNTQTTGKGETFHIPLPCNRSHYQFTVLPTNRRSWELRSLKTLSRRLKFRKTFLTRTKKIVAFLNICFQLPLYLDFTKIPVV